MPEPHVFLNGHMVPASQAHVNIYDLGVVMGATVTEMVRTFHKRPYRLEDHLARLARSLRYVRFDIGMSMEEFAAASRELLQHNGRLLGDEDELGLVLFVTAGENRTYAGSAAHAARLKPTVCAHTFPIPFEMWDEQVQQGMHVVTPSIRHVPPQCYDPNMKYRSRMHFFLAEQEAQLVDPHASALLLDLSGNVAETGGANFFIVQDGTLVSPTLTNILPGISRAVVIELATKLDIPFVERDFQVFDVVNADEAFTSTTPYCMMPVTRINGLPIADGTPGPIYKRLLEAWSREVDLDIRRQIIDGAKRRREG